MCYVWNLKKPKNSANQRTIKQDPFNWSPDLESGPPAGLICNVWNLKELKYWAEVNSYFCLNCKSKNYGNISHKTRLTGPLFQTMG